LGLDNFFGGKWAAPEKTKMMIAAPTVADKRERVGIIKYLLK
jgi:hypothetical protein